MPAVARRKIVARRRIGPRQLVDPLIGTPDHSPGLAVGRGQDVVVLGVDAVEFEVAVEALQPVGVLVFAQLGDQRTAGQIAIDDDLQNVVVQIAVAEIPVVVIGFVEEVESV